MNDLQKALSTALKKRKEAHTFRTLSPIIRKQSSIIRRNNSMIDVSSNDYLGLAHHPFLSQRASEWAELYGTGAQASRLVSGTLTLHTHIEKKIAAFKKSESALLFSSGWQANASIIPALNSLSLQETGTPASIFMDRLNHASLHHGCLSAGIRQIRFQHNNLNHLETLLKKHSSDKGLKFIITESVFSMDGDRADIPTLRQLADHHNAFLYVDEAHATGVLGPQGSGLSQGLADITMSTASKALGGMGAFITGSQSLCHYLLNQASGFIYSTALPPSVLGALDAALELVPSMEKERHHLHCIASQLRETLQKCGWSTGNSSTHILPIMLESNERALYVAQRLEEEGFLSVAIRPPTVPPKTARLRIALHSGLSTQQIDHLQSILTRILLELPT